MQCKTIIAHFAAHFSSTWEACSFISHRKDLTLSLQAACPINFFFISCMRKRIVEENQIKKIEIIKACLKCGRSKERDTETSTSLIVDFLWFKFPSIWRLQICNQEYIYLLTSIEHRTSKVGVDMGFRLPFDLLFFICLLRPHHYKENQILVTTVSY